MRSLILFLPVLIGCMPPNENPWLTRKTGENLVVDGDFEEAELGQMNSPWINRPIDRKDPFQVKEGKAKEGARYLTYEGQPQEWWGISQKIQLKKEKKYTASFWIKGDSTEVHTGAFNSGKFLGWNNATVPSADWQLVAFDFYTDTASAETTIYIAALHPSKAYSVDIDDLRVVQELPTK